MSNDKKMTTAQKQTQDALQTKVLGRDIRFRIKSKPAENVVELICASCGHDFNIRECKENYFFNCPVCKIIGNLPGVLAAQVDREFADEKQQREREEKIQAIRQKFPVPEAVAAPLPQVRRQST